MKTSNAIMRNGRGLHGGDFLTYYIDHSPNTYTFMCVNSWINVMEAHSCGGELILFKLCFPKNKVYLICIYDMNLYLVPSSIYIIVKFFLSIHRYGRYQ